MLCERQPDIVDRTGQHCQTGEAIRWAEGLQRRLFYQPDPMPTGTQLRDSGTQAIGQTLFGNCAVVMPVSAFQNVAQITFGIAVEV
ncbi:hypothetical protein D9M73_240340 [compost metagenome]